MSRKLSPFGEAFVSYGSYHCNPVYRSLTQQPVDPHRLRAHHRGHPHICPQLPPSPPAPQGVQPGSRCLRFGPHPRLLLHHQRALRGRLCSTQLGMLVIMAITTAGWQLAFAGMEQQTFLLWVVGIHITAWVLQFIGHGVFESSHEGSQNASRPCLTTSPRSSTPPSSWSSSSSPS
jgi:hypothetical protein